MYATCTHIPTELSILHAMPPLVMVGREKFPPMGGWLGTHSNGFVLTRVPHLLPLLVPLDVRAGPPQRLAHELHGAAELHPAVPGRRGEAGRRRGRQEGGILRLQQPRKCHECCHQLYKLFSHLLLAKLCHHDYIRKKHHYY